VDDRATDLWLIGGAVLLMYGAVARSQAFGTLGLLLLVSILVARAWARYSLSNVTYTRSLSADRVYSGECVSLEIVVTNAKPLVLPWLLVEDRLDTHLLAHNVETERSGRAWEIRHSVAVGWYERVRWRYTIECSRRGYHRIGPTRLASGDPFGFYERERELPAQAGVLVYPRLLPVEELDLSSVFPFEGRRSSAGLVPDPLNVVGARPYVETDTQRQVHWRATARGAELRSKTTRPTVEPNVVIFLDLASTRHPWEGINTEAAERAISAAATLAHRAHAQRQPVGLHVNGLRSGTHQRIRIGAARGDEALAQIMDVLARVPPYPTIPFVDLLRTERRRALMGATIVAITAVCSLEIADQTALYRRRGCRAVLLDVGASPVEDSAR